MPTCGCCRRIVVSTGSMRPMAGRAMERVALPGLALVLRTTSCVTSDFASHATAGGGILKREGALL